jgi:hypothetical protein
MNGPLSSVLQPTEGWKPQLFSGKRYPAARKALPKLGAMGACFPGEPPSFGLAQPLLLLKPSQV